MALTAKLAEYNARRDRIDRDTEIERREVANFENARFYARAAELKMRLDRRIAPEHVRLGLWCEANGLKPEALAHFTTALQLDPHHEATWRHLGYIKHHGRWMSREQIAADEREALAQKHADRHWEPLLHRWAAELREPRRRALPRQTLRRSRTRWQSLRSCGSSARARQPGRSWRCVFSGRSMPRPPLCCWRASRFTATTPACGRQRPKRFRGREPRDYAGRLVNLIRAPMTYEMRPVGGPGSQGVLVVDSPRFRITRTYNAPPAFRLASNFRGYVGYDLNGMPLVMSGNDLKQFNDDLNHYSHWAQHATAAEGLLRRAEERTAEMLAAAQINAVIARERLAADVRDIEESNAEARGAQPAS